VELVTPATILSALPHGEHGAVVRLLTPGHGLRAGYVRGGRSRALRPVLAPGNRVQARLRARTAEQLAQLTVEPERSRAALALDAATAAGLGWVTALLAAALPEDDPHPPLFDALEALLESMAGEPLPAWAADLARLERDLLAELGFGLDLAACALSGSRDELAFLSPRTGRAASRAAGAPWAQRLLALPPLLLPASAGPAPPDHIIAALAATGHFLRRDALGEAWARLEPARARLLALVDKSAAAPPAPAMGSP
jgi:DNA repair protein RecO (recombination protein O)